MDYKVYDFDIQKIKKREQLLLLGENPYPYNFTVSHSICDLANVVKKSEDKNLPLDVTVNITGRIWSQRDMGKSIFLDLKDGADKIQVYCKLDSLDKNTIDRLSLLDIGDIVGVIGHLFKTNTNQLSIFLHSIHVLSKTVVPIPIGKEAQEKTFNRLDTPESKLKERYLHWILDTESKRKIIERFQIISEIRNWMESQGFLEVTTPNIEPIYGGAEARPFTTCVWALDNQQAYLRISPELYLKRYIIAGFSKVFTICQNFRNEGIDHSHNPEFTMMEWYEAYSDYTIQMNRFEMLVSYLCEKIYGDMVIEYQGQKINFKPPWRRMTMMEAIKYYTGIDVDTMGVQELKKELLKIGIEYSEDITWGIAVVELFEATCEQHLIQPTFILDHPYDLSPMTKEKRGDKRLVERFEPFVCGMEIGNAYSEMTDPILQLKRFIEQKEMQYKRQTKDKDYEDNPIDIDFIKAIGCGMPPTGGVGLGIDRLIMILTNTSSIRDIIPFPMVKRTI